MTATQSPSRRWLDPFRSLLASVLALLVVVVVLVVPAGIASAHTSFEQSTPSDGATISEPVEVITLQFSGVSEPADGGFTVLTPDGHLRTPASVSTTDQKVFDLTFDPPLAGGQVGVRWSVSAPDAHPIGGAFSFTVTAPASVPTSATDAATVGTIAGDPSVTASAATGTDVGGSDSAGAMVMDDGSAMDMSSASPSLDDFLSEQPDRNGASIARWGRLIEFAALTLLIGGAVFAATTLRGRRSEIDRTIAVLRILGVALAGGALLEYVGVAQLAQASIVSYWTSQPGLATLWRGAGGIAIAVGLVAVTVPVRLPRPAHSLSAAVNLAARCEQEERTQFWQGGDEHQTSHRPDRPAVQRTEVPSAVRSIPIDPLLHRHHHGTAPAHDVARPSITISTAPPPRPSRPTEVPRKSPTPRSDVRHDESPVIRQWVLNRASAVAFVGAAIAVMSFWFDGHTVSKGPRILHAIVNSVHVVAGSIWLGGVVAMAVVLWTRHRSGVAPRALEMIVRFSGIATFALGAVLAAGGVLAFIVLDSVGQLFFTPWGQILLLKSTAVGLAMVGGAYNHFRLLPALEADPDDPQLVEPLRSAVTSEAILLGFVIVVTASLVAAAS